MTQPPVLIHVPLPSLLAAPRRSSLLLLASIPFYCVLNSQPGYAFLPSPRLLLPRSGACLSTLQHQDWFSSGTLSTQKKGRRKKKEKKMSLLENPAAAKVRIRPRRSIYTCATCDPQLHFHAVRLSPCPRLSPRIPQCSSRAVTFWVGGWWDIWSRVENSFFWRVLQIISGIMWISLIPQFIWDTTCFTRSNPDGEVDEKNTLDCVTSQPLIKGLSRSGRLS